MKQIKLFKRMQKEVRIFACKARERSLFHVREYSALLLLCGGSIFLFSGFIILDKYVPQKSLSITFFDVGQGDAIFIESGTHTKVLIDGGPSRKVLSLIDRDLPFFDRKVDAVLPTHADADHIVGAIQVIDTFTVPYSSVIHASSSTELDDMYLTRLRSKEVLDLVSGDSINLGGGAVLSVILPFKGETFSDKETNESSQVTLLTYQGFSFLLTGDLPMERERYLVESGLLPERVSVLKLGHHGSKGSSGALLLQKTKPWYAVVSAGKDNRYGHPHKETLERVEKAGSVLLRTDELGSITFLVRGGKMSYVVR